MSGRDVVLVHGAWHGPWCWNDWVHALADHGHRPRTVTLPGHGAPGTTDRIWRRLGEYVDTVAQELAFLGPEAVIVGHSMGGLVTQLALQREPAALGILLASVPPSGVLGATVRTARRAPFAFARTNLKLSMSELVSTSQLTREAFFTDDASDEDVERAHEELQNESFLAYLQMFVVRPRARKVAAPIRVLSGERDAIFSVPEQRALARRYDTEAEVFEGAGHDLMLGPWSDDVLGRVLELIDSI